MDIIGISIALTFLSMMAIAGFAMSSHHPPLQKFDTTCPETSARAHVRLDWDQSQRAVRVAECDHPQHAAGCSQACLRSLAPQFGLSAPTTVLG